MAQEHTREDTDTRTIIDCLYNRDGVCTDHNGPRVYARYPGRYGSPCDTRCSHRPEYRDK
jgi:hypothetical protein